MEIYTLDAHLRRQEVIDRYISFIWTERYNSAGDFQLVLKNTKRHKEIFAEGTIVSILQSKRLMIVDTAEEDFDDDGSEIFKVVGYSLELLLKGRPGIPLDLNNLINFTMSYENSKWQLTGTPRNIVNGLFRKVCSGTDGIPWLTLDEIPTGNILFSSEEITVSLDLSDLYSSISSLCSQLNMGFAIIKPDVSASEILIAGVYKGNDRTSSQRTLSPVIFSKKLGTLTNVKSIKTQSNYKNVAYVYGLNGTAIVYNEFASESTSGFDKKVLVVNAMDITTVAGPGLTAELELRGRQELRNYRKELVFDGEESKTSGYTYGDDYSLGDLIDFQDSYGNTNHMYVTEQIFVSDKEGDRSYPTLVFDTATIEGTWDSLSSSLVWNDAVGTWDDM